MKKDIVVIGGGPAGITLAKELGKTFNMGVIRPEDHSMIYCAMPYVIEGLLPFEKTLKKDSLVTEAGAELIRDRVKAVNFTEKKILLETKKEIFWDKLVIATGAYPFIPPLQGKDLKGIMGFKWQQDMEKIYQLCEKGLKKAVIIGAGAIGVELAQALNERNVKVSLIDMANFVLSNMVDKEMVVDATNQLTANGINLVLGEKVKSFEGKEYVKQVVLDSGIKIATTTLDDCSEGSNPDLGLVVFAAGVRPEISFLKDSPIKIGNDGISVNEYMETNIQDVYACGDCAEFKSGITGQIVSGKLATNAVPMAKILAANIKGEKRPYSGFFNGAATKVGNIYVGGTGITERIAELQGFDVVSGYSELTTQFPIMPKSRLLKIKIIARKETGQIIGGQVISGEPVAAKIDLITFAIQQKTTVYDLRDLSYSSQPYQSFFPAANAFVIASEQIIKKYHISKIFK